MAFSSKHIIWCQANPQSWPKMDSLRASLAQITCVHDCRLMQMHCKVKIDSQTRTVKPGVGIVHGILSQPHIFCHADHQFWPKKRAAPGLIWPRLHVFMGVVCFRSAPKSKMIHEKGLQSLGWESYMGFSSKHVSYCLKLTPKFG